MRLLELLFRNKKWARKLHGGRWLHLKQPGYDWLVYENTVLDGIKWESFVQNLEYETEDYR